MLKYKSKGGERKACSPACVIFYKTKSVLSNAAKKANKTRFTNHVYKSHQNDIARGKSEYSEWRKAVFERDNYTCQECGAHNHKGAGKAIVLHPHHIKPFATYTELRYVVSNGITLCASCHRKKHNHVFIGRSKKSPVV